MRILITGATGFLGSRALWVLRGDHEVAALPSELLRADMTLDNREKLYAGVAAAAPEMVFHAAAISSIPDAEANPERSYRANVVLAEALAQVSARLGSRMVFCSTDQVYTGQEGLGPYPETAPLHPVNVYARHKLEAEERILEVAPDAVALRLSWMYDLPARGLPTHRNLLTNLLTSAARGETLALSDADYRGVTYACAVAQRLPRAAALPGGVYNFGSGGLRSVYAIACAWRDALRLREGVLESTEGNRRSLCMDDAKLRAHGLAFEPSDQGILDCIRDYQLDRI